MKRWLYPCFASLLLLAGCRHLPGGPDAAEGWATGAVPSEAGRESSGKNNDKNSATQTENGDANKPTKPSPHTLPEAICAYLRSLHEPLPPRQDDKDKKQENGNGSEKSANGDKASNSNGKKNGDKDKTETLAEPRKLSPKDSDKNGDKDKPGQESKDKDSDKDKNKDKDKDKENGKDSSADSKEKDKDKDKPEPWGSAHAQATMVMQMHDVFPSPYIGPHSLLPKEPSATSETSTLFLDARLWEGGELIFNPEIAGGVGFSGVNGIAGFPNGEITRIGQPSPTPYVARLYLRQTCGFGGEREKVEDVPNQIAGYRDIDRLTFSMGKFASTDFIDNNVYSHDPRTSFMAWSIMFNGAWDYPANTRGYTYGFTWDLNHKYWALRYGVFAEPIEANGDAFDPQFLKANGHAIEYERRWGLDEHPGALRVMTYANHANMGNYGDATREMPVNPNVTLTETYRFKYGFGATAEQEVTKDVGLFARWGWNDGHSETWAFTPIDRTLLLGSVVKGTCWRRPDDLVGLAFCCNGIGKSHREYLAAGGLDFNLGDGALNYGFEKILETFYVVQVHKGIFVTGDFQEVVNPAYNRDRGPVSIFTLRVHVEL